tara:strand:+ start:466 stop:1029 length:564 start_codon:yes stop_codon:yes gene_type:complete
MAIDKITSASITTDAVGPTQLNEASNYAFTGTVTGAGEKNSPCFMAVYIGSGVEISDATETKVTFDTEIIDVGAVYDTTNKRYTPGFVGKSYISTGMYFYDASKNIQHHVLYFYKNGSLLTYFKNEPSGEVKRVWQSASLIVDHNATDYYEVYVRADTSNGGNIEVPATSGGASSYRNYFQGFKILT